MFNEDEKPIEGYGSLSDNKKSKLKEKFFDKDFQDYKEKKKIIQKRKERVAKLGVVGILIVINTIMFLFQILLPQTNNLALFDINSEQFFPSQIFTHMFLHGGLLHLGINMFVLWSFGKPLEKTWATKKFLLIYLLSGIGGGLLALLFSVYYDYPMMVGASGAISGLVGAMAVLSPDSKVLLFFFIPAKIRPLVLGFAVFSLVCAIFGWIPGIGHAAHLGGLVVGYLIALYWKKKGNLYTTFI